MKLDRHTLCFLAILLLGAALYVPGLTRGDSDFVLAERAQQGIERDFYHFHPDERTLVRGALDLRTALDPPLTAYGMVPLYILRGSLEMVAYVLGLDTLDTPNTVRPVYYTARVLAALFASIHICLVWWVGRRFLSAHTACLGAFFVAIVPLAIQQAHFFTVDGLFAPVVVGTFGVIMSALSSGKRRHYIAAGILIGVAGATRLNGVLLGLVLLAGHCAQDGIKIGAIVRRLADARLWWAAAAAVLTLFVLQPFMLVEPQRMWRAETTNDFALSLQIANGTLLRPWTLVDVHTTPYLHYWTALWPRGVGWPLTAAFVLGMAYALRRLDLIRSLMLLWIVLYFLPVGNLHTKHVRYLLVLLPFVSLLAADVYTHLRHCGTPFWRRLTLICTTVVALYSVGYGLAFARIYNREDSRISAARWLTQHVAPGHALAVEEGGFTLLPLVSQEQFKRQVLGVNRLFNPNQHLCFGLRLQFLYDRVKDLDYIAIIDVNRYRQLTAVPDMYPVIAGFYRRLVAGELGFTLVQTFKNYPSLFGMTFVDDEAEPTFLGYDHPTVWVLARQSETQFAAAWKRWETQIAQESPCPDPMLAQAADLIRKRQWSLAQDQVQQLSQTHPDAKVVRIMEVAIRRQLGQVEQATAALEHYRANYRTLDSPDAIPFYTSLILEDLGLPNLALFALADGVLAARQFDTATRRRMADLYMSVGARFNQRQDERHTNEVYRLAAQLYEAGGEYTRQGMALYRAGRIDESASAYQQTLSLNPNNVAARVNLGWNYYLQGKLDQAIGEYRHVLEKEKNNRVAWFNLALAYLTQGDIEKARRTYADAVAKFGATAAAEMGVTAELNDLIARGIQVEAARAILQTHWP